MTLGAWYAQIRAEYAMPDAIDLLKTRRSVKPIELTGPGPAAAELDTLLTVASRVPDHGKLTPWRFIVFDGDARLKAGETIERIFRADHPESTEDQVAFERNRLARAPLVVAVVSRAAPHVIGRRSRAPYAKRTTSDARQGCRCTAPKRRDIGFCKRGHRAATCSARQRPSI